MSNTSLKTALILSAFFAFTQGCVNDPQLESPQPGSHSNARAGSSSINFHSNKYIIISASNQLPQGLESDVNKANGQIQNKLNEVGLATATSDDPEFATKAAKIKGVRSVVRDFEAQWYDPSKEQRVEFDPSFGNPPSSGDDDTRFDLQWGHDAIDAPEAWTAGHRGNGVKVAVLDTGFDLDHPDLAPNIIGQASFVPGEGPSYALGNPFSHGTHVAGTIAAADNAFGTIGVAPEAKLLLVKVLPDAGSGDFSWLLQGILYAVSEEADVINMSLGAYLPRNGENGAYTKEAQELIVAITRVTNYAYQKGVTIIAAAGNDAINGNKDQSGIHLPSGVPNVISISATAPVGWASDPTTNLDVFTDYSNYGTADVAFAAPGGNVWDGVLGNCTVAGLLRPCYVFDLVFSTGSSLIPGQALYYWSGGTSMASPHAAGVAALIIGKNGGSMPPSQVEAAMRASADDLGKPGKDPYFGHGRVNALRAVTN